MPIHNRDRFPNIDFLPPEQFKIVGDAEGIPLIKVGTEQGTNALVVAKSFTSNPQTEDLHAVPAYELIAHSYGPININENE